MRTSNDDTWTTPKKFFGELNYEFNFGLDAAALSSSTLVPDNWYGPDHPEPERRDAFARCWSFDANNKPIWLNPPYGRTIGEWVKKANVEVARGGWLSALFLLALILRGGTITVSSTRLDLSEVASSLAIKRTPHLFPLRWW